MSMQDWHQREMTRRRFLAVAGVATGSTLLAACGGGGDEPGDAAAPEAAGTTTMEAELEEELNVLNWGGYIDFAIEPFEEKFGVKINIEHYGSEAEAFAKVR